jgi:hypothetical protein
MAGEVNYGLVNPAVLDYAGQEQKALNVEKSRFDVKRLEEERKLMLGMQKQLADSGQDPDLNIIFDTMIRSGNPDYMSKGLEGKSKLKEQQDYAAVRSKYASGGGGGMPAPTAPGSYGAPMTPITSAGAPTPTNALIPMGGARQPAPGVNALAPAVDEASMLQAQINDYGNLGTTQGFKMAEMLQKRLDALAPTSDIKNFRYGEKNPTFANYQLQQKRAGASSTKVILPEQEKEFEKELGGGQAKAIIKSREGAEDAASILQTNQVGRDILNSGAITGAGADFFVGLNQGLKTAGIDAGYGDAAANSQAYGATMASNVGKLIKQYGAGTGLSDADREFATKAAAGSVNMDEKAIRRVLDINDRAARNIITGHNKKVEGIKTNIPLKIEIPSAPAPSGAADMLRKNPNLASQYDAKYGAGAAAKVLGR